MPRSCTKMGIRIIFILFLTFKISSLLYFWALRPKVLIRGVPLRGLNSFPEVLGSFRGVSIPSQKFWEAFDGHQFLLGMDVLSGSPAGYQRQHGSGSVEPHALCWLLFPFAFVFSAVSPFSAVSSFSAVSPFSAAAAASATARGLVMRPGCGRLVFGTVA